MVNLVKSRGYSYFSTLKWVVRNSKEYMKKSTKYLRIYKTKSAAAAAKSLQSCPTLCDAMYL